MSDIKSMLRQVYVEALRLDRSPDTIPDNNLTAVLGLDSINSLEVLVIAENRFNIQIDDADLSVTLVDSLDVLAAYIEKKRAASGDTATAAAAERSAELV